MIGHVGLTPAGNVVFEVVVAGPRRVHVTMPRKRATGDDIDIAIRHALDAVPHRTRDLPWPS